MSRSSFMVDFGQLPLKALWIFYSSVRSNFTIYQFYSEY
ncbi:hypothetical protein L963_1229 [Leuconostoc mesenteroides subsp. cremoris T26]|nr:hypothetical protein L963_1229 [Leuconostoc mesenteroides subsp. cremoris T26]